VRDDEGGRNNRDGSRMMIRLISSFTVITILKTNISPVPVQGEGPNIST
jgi:hypothetical protein